MALLWALTVLSLLPLLDAQSPECANLMTVAPITNATLDWLTGKWFYIGSAFRNPEYNESARMIQAAFFYFEPRHAEDKLIVRDYQTIADKCIYNRSTINIYRQNGTMSKIESDREHFADLLLNKHLRTFMLAASWNGTKNVGVSFYADKPEVTQEQKKEFLDVIKCIGIQESEITYSDEKKELRKRAYEHRPRSWSRGQQPTSPICWLGDRPQATLNLPLIIFKKDVCGPLEKQHQEERKKETEAS